MNKLELVKGFLHGGDYNPDQWLKRPDILDRDYQLMDQSKINTVTVGVFAWGRLEPEEGVYDFAWLDDVFDKMNSRNGHVILATPSGARPRWMSQKYPEVNRVDSEGRRHTHGFRHNHCYSSPIYRRKVHEINMRLAERYGDNSALVLWHVSNEYSGECYCPLCQQKWREWVQHKYKTLEALDDAWCSSVWSGLYSDWSQLLPPSLLGDSKVHGMDLDWHRFVSDMTIDFYQHEIQPLKKVTPNIPVTTNFMAESLKEGQYTPLTGLDYGRFAKSLDIISWDSYPSWHNRYETTAETAMKTAYVHDQFWSLKQQPFLVMESTPSCVNWGQYNKAKQPGMHRLSSFQQIAHGSDSTLYFQIRQAQGNSEKYHGAVIGHDDSSDSRVFKDVQQYGQDLEKIVEVKGAIKRVRVAILFDWDSNWALNRGGCFGRPTRLGIQVLQKHYANFWHKDIECNVITSDMDFSQYDLLIAPMLYLIRQDTMKKLQKFVQSGGTLVSSYFSGMVDSNDRVNLDGWPKPLQDIFGIEPKELDTLLPGEHYHVSFNQKEYETTDYDQIMKVKNASVLGYYTDNFYVGTPAITRHQYGKGTAYYIGARLSAEFIEDFYDDIIQSLNLDNSFVELSNPVVSVQTRYNEDYAYHFVMNFSEQVQMVNFRRPSFDLLTQREVTKSVQIDKYGVMILKERQNNTLH